MFRSLRSMIRSLTRKRPRPSKPAARMMAYRKFGLQLQHLESRDVPATILGWDFDPLTGGSGNYGPSPLTPTTSDPGIVGVVGLTRGSGVGISGTGAANAWGGNDWEEGTDLSSAVANNNFFTFGYTVATGTTTSLTEISAFNIRRSGTGPTTYQFQYSLDGVNFTDIGSSATIGANTGGTGNPQAAISLSGITALQSIPAGTVVTFRGVFWGATGATGTGYLNDGAGTPGNDFILDGTVSGVSSDAIISFTNPTYTQLEGTGGTTTATVGLTRSGNLASEVTVLVTTSPGTPAPTPGAGPGFGAGEDYITQSTTVTFAAGSATPTVPFAVAINPDSAIEANEQITITLSAPTVVTGGGTASIGGSTTAPLTIQDDDAAAPAGLLLNEIYFNPPGTDAGNEFVEIRNTTGSPVSLNNVYYVVVEGDDIAASAGTADRVIDLTGQTVPANGILVIKSSLSTLNFGSATVFNTTAFDADAIENGANTHFLVFSSTPIVQGTDYDSTNDGVIDAGSALANATVLDRVGYFEASSGEFTYGPTIPRFANVTPDSISRFAANTTADSAGAWFGGAIVSSLPLTYAETIALDGLPLGAVVTPGAANYATPAAGQIRFASSGFSGSEGGNITVTLTRTGGTTGAVNAVVTAAELSNTFPGTESFRATSGSDFAASPAPVNNLSLSWSGGVVTVSAIAHGFSAGDGVAIAGATDGYNGGFVVASVIDINTFTYALATNPGTAFAAGTSQRGILVSWAAGDGADKSFNLAVPQDTDAEGNEAFDLRIAGVSGGAVTTIRTAAGVVNADDLATAAPVVYLNEVKVDAAGSDGPFEYIELRGAPNQVLTNVYVVSVEGDSQVAGITGATWTAGTATLTLTGTDTQGIVVGDQVVVAGVNPAGYNGTFTVTAVSGNTLSYALATDPGTYIDSGTADSVTGPQAGKPGTFDYVFDLTGQSLGSNGLLIIKSATGHVSVDPATTVVIDSRFDGTSGILENGTVSHLVIYSPTALVQATTPAGGPYELASDYDQDNNGSLEQLPAGAVLLDGIGWNDGGIGDVSYGTFLTSGVSAFPPNMAATRVLESTTPFAVNGFRQGELLFTTNAELAYDFANANAPSGGALTPGGANFSQVANAAGTFSFTTAVVNTTEGASVVLTVQRLGGSTGAVSVAYAIADISTTGADYGTPTPASPLSWADGDSTPQTITIPIVDDPDAEGAEQFTVTLSAPTGGASLGSPSVATVTIAASDIVVATNVRINEVDSDTPGTDAAEFIELYDGGVGNTSLTGLVVVLYNGATDTSYAAFDLDGFTTNAQGYFVLGNAGVTGVGLTFAGNLLQNGADAVALYVGDAAAFPNGTAVTATGIVDAVVYDTADADDTGLISVLTPGQPQIDEAANSLSADQSIARVPNGGTALNTTTYVTQAPTPNASNVGAPDTTPPTIAPANFVDNVSGGPVNVNTAVTYTLTFSEDIIDAGGGALTAADLNNAGTSAVTIGTITETSPGVFTVVVTPTTAGTLQLRIPTGASVTDLAGNPLAVPVADDTTITVNAVANNGTFQFSAATYSTNEGVGTFSVTVTRTGGSTGAVTVPFTVTAGTATSPGDYTVVSTSPISFADLQLSQVITFSIVDDGSGESPEDFSVALGTPSAGALGATASATVTVTDPLLLVSSLTATNSGVVVQFNRAFDATTLNLYDAAGGTLGAADVTVAGTTGSLVVLPGNQLYFIKTGAEIAAGTYATTIRSAADGLKDLAGVLLDGDANATAGGNFAGNFTVAAYTDKVVRVGDFTRGRTQTVSIPLTISDGTGVTAVDAELIYDPALLDFGTGTITSPVAGWSGSFNPNFQTLPNGLRVAKFNVFSATALPAGQQVFANIPATVPATALYANKEVLRLQNTFWNESNVIRTDDAVHVAAYFGDTTGNGGLSGQDASLVSQLAAGSGTGFVAYQNADPVLIADTTQNGGLSGQDASLISQKAAGATIASIPDPGPANPAQGGPDPRMYFGSFTAAQGATVTVPMRFNVAEPGGINGVQSMDVAGTFDAARFTVSNVRYKPGSPWALAGWSVTANVDNVTGTFRVITFANTVEATLGFVQDYDDESLLFDFFVKPTAPVGTSPLNIAQNVGSTITAINEGAFTLLPAPTNATNDANVDGTFTVTAATTSANLFWAGANVAAGATFTTQLRVSNNGTANWTATSVDSASTFDPTKLQIVSVTAGSLLTGAPTPWTVTANIDNVNGTLRVVTFASNTPGITLIPGQVGDVLNVTFQVAPTATGTTYIDLRPVVNPTTTAIDEGAVTLSPAPADATNQSGVDAVITIAVNPNKPPFNAVPAAAQQVLWNSTQQVATPNTVVFSAGNGNAIAVTDGNGVVNVTTTLSVGTTGTLTLGSTAGVAVTGNGTGTVTVAGTTADVTAALDGLTYQPNAGFHGDVLLTVVTTDGGNSGFGGPLTDTRTVVVQVVGLFISEVLFNDGTNSTAAGNLNEYIEVFSTAPNYTIPSDVYFVGIEGDAGTGANNPGLVQDIFRLGGFVTGANGYLALLQKAQQYGAGFALVEAGNVAVNASAGATGNNNSAGFGNGGTTSRYDADEGGTTFLTNVHSGQSATAPTGTRPDATGEFNTDIENGSVSYILVQSAVAPAIGNDIDADNNGVADGAVFGGWNVSDSVAALDGGATDRGYAAITFRTNGNGTGTGNTVTTAFNPGYVGRVLNFKGSSSADWLASSVPTGSGGMFTLGTTTNPAFDGQSLNHVGGVNAWAPRASVTVNDGSSDQRSQVSQLLVGFTGPALLDLNATAFAVYTSDGTAVSINVTPVDGTDNLDGTFSDVTQVKITFNVGVGTFAFAAADPLGNTVGLTDGNFFLKVFSSQVSVNGVNLDGDGDGFGGGNQIEQFHRLFGDTNGDRAVDGVDNALFNTTRNKTSADGEYLWFLDADLDGDVFNDDRTQFRNRLWGYLPPSTTPPSILP